MTFSLIVFIGVLVLGVVHGVRFGRWRSTPEFTQHSCSPSPDWRRTRSISLRDERRQGLYPRTFRILPDIYRFRDAESVIDAINRIADDIDRRLERIANQAAAPTFPNTVLALQEPLYEMQQLEHVLDYYSGLLPRVRDVAQQYHQHDDRRTIIQDTLQQVGAVVLDADRIESRIKRVKRTIREWIRTHSEPDRDLTQLMIELVELRRHAWRLRSVTDQSPQIEHYLTDISNAFQIPFEDEIRSTEDWDRVQSTALAQIHLITEPLFDLECVLFDGLFTMATDLYGLHWKGRAGPDPDQRIFDVFDDDGDKVGTLIFDLLESPEKHGSARTLVLVEPCEYVHVRDHVILILMNELQRPADGETVLMTFEEVGSDFYKLVFSLFYEFGHALYKFMFPSQCMLQDGVTETALQMPSIAAILHQRLAMNPGILHRINPSLSSPQIDEIISEISLISSLMATDDLSRAILAQAWWRASTCQDIALDQHVTATILGRLGFAALEWRETVKFLLRASSSWYWTEPVADLMASRLYKCMRGSMSPEIGQMIMSVFSQRSLDEINERINELENPSPKTLCESDTTESDMQVDGSDLSHPSPLLDHRNTVETGTMVTPSDHNKTSSQYSSLLSIFKLRLPVCFRA